MELQDFISVQEATKISEYNGRTITYLCKTGKLKGAVKIGHQWFIPKKAIEEYKPGPQGFAAVWQRRRENEKTAKPEIKAEKIENPSEKENLEREILECMKILIGKFEQLEKIIAQEKTSS